MEKITDLDLYQFLALETAVYPERGNNLLYPALKLAGESGEYADKIGKFWRNTGKWPNNENVLAFSPSLKVELLKELGDALWYIAASAKELGYSMSEVASTNIEKLRDRRDRGVIKSQGDNR